MSFRNLIKSIFSSESNIALKLKVARLKDINDDLMREHEEYLILYQNQENFKREILMDLLDIQDIDKLEMSEEDKIKHRNTIIDKAIKKALGKINELDKSWNTSSSQNYLTNNLLLIIPNISL